MTTTADVHYAEIRLEPGGSGSVIVDGMDISHLITHDLTIVNQRHAYPCITVSLMGLTVDARIGGEVKVTDETAAALELLGWRKPE